MGFGFVGERFGLFLRMVAHQPESVSQRNFSLVLGVLLLLLGAVVALVSARQFRQVVKSLGPQVVPPKYWTHVGVGSMSPSHRSPASLRCASCSRTNRRSAPALPRPRNCAAVHASPTPRGQPRP